MKQIDRFPRYEFHEGGYVISRMKKTPIIMKPIKMGGYTGVTLTRADGHVERAYLHRLICEAFHGPCPEGFQCRHLDGDKTNNAASNLAWGSAKQNATDKLAHGTSGHGEKNPMAKLTRENVLEMREIRQKTKHSYKIIAEKFGVSTMTAFRAITGQSWRNQ